MQGQAAAVAGDLSEYGFTTDRELVHVAISIRVDELSMRDRGQILRDRCVWAQYRADDGGYLANGSVLGHQLCSMIVYYMHTVIHKWAFPLPHKHNAFNWRPQFGLSSQLSSAHTLPTLQFVLSLPCGLDFFIEI